jgi:predicted RNA binding protein YcfA (HicA-like mRNA interferase family)
MSRQLPTLKPREVIRALERAGFRLLRVKGSHHYFHHPSASPFTLAISNDPSCAPSFAKPISRSTRSSI